MSTAPKTVQSGVEISRLLSSAKVAVFDTVAWDNRDAVITNMKGETVFEQKNVRVPMSWSQTATNIVASKYLHGKLGTSQRETGVDDLIHRVVDTITEWGIKDSYFSNDNALNFQDELATLLLNQYAAFNSPVWFNVGCDRIEPDSKTENWHWNFDEEKIEYSMVGYTRPQVSACFINGVKDDMRSILGLSLTEGMLFKWGSGSGVNMSSLRSEGESLAGGGTASGPLSFMKGFDAFAGVIKSGGKTRRAAKMVMLNVDHPDIEAFIDCKMQEEAKAHALIAAGYDGSGPDSEAYSSIFFQNANNSVRASDEFMKAAERGEQIADDWKLKSVTTGKTVRTTSASILLDKIASATWASGDPGMQFDTTINRMNTCSTTGRINASNPCSEFMFLDDTACNLASLNLRMFMDSDGTFNVKLFRHAVRILIIAMDILVDNAGYPTEEIAKNSHDFRPLGLGYANLGAMLMEMGLPYDSDEARELAAGITSLMTATAYAVSAELSEELPPLKAANAAGLGFAGFSEIGGFPGLVKNEDAMLAVIKKHGQSALTLSKNSQVRGNLDIRSASLAAWQNALSTGKQSGFRNSQVTVLAPTGTIGFMMDCDTTGVEPMLGLVVNKKLVGGGYMQLANETLKPALARLGYDPEDIAEIVQTVADTGTVEGAIDEDDYAVFDCALKPFKGTRTISSEGHLKMMAAVQPFLSGAISKTVNMSEESTVKDIRNAYILAWKLGIKSVAIYRDGSKKNQILTVKKEGEPELLPVVGTGRYNSDGSPATAVQMAKRLEEVRSELLEDLDAPPKANRHRLPDEREAVTHKFNIGGHEGYLTVGLYKNGAPGEIFITMSKEGSTMSGVMDSFATVVSVALQHGVPLRTLIEKLSHTRFEPSGWSHNEKIGYAKSIMDYIFRWLDQRFIQVAIEQPAPKLIVLNTAEAVDETMEQVLAVKKNEGIAGVLNFGDSPTCSTCGAIMGRNGSCYRCSGCGASSGCS